MQFERHIKIGVGGLGKLGRLGDLGDLGSLGSLGNLGNLGNLGSLGRLGNSGGMGITRGMGLGLFVDQGWQFGQEYYQGCDEGGDRE